jgi:nicotinamidase-related amidase
VSEPRPVLLVIDAQNGFVSGGSAPVIPVIEDLVRRWLGAGGHVIFTRYRNYPGSPFERLIGWRELHGAPATDLIDVLAPFAEHRHAHVVDKTTYSAFTPGFRGHIAERGFTDLYICGIATDGCVLATAYDAFDEGLTPWVIGDACASNATRHPPADVHRAALMLIARNIGEGQITSAARALAALPVAADGG